MAEAKAFEQLLRPVYEARAAVGWGIAGLWLMGIAIFFHAPKLGMLACVLLAAAMTAAAAAMVGRCSGSACQHLTISSETARGTQLGICAQHTTHDAQGTRHNTTQHTTSVRD